MKQPTRNDLPDEDSTAYKNEETLQRLYVDRCWTRFEIAEYFSVPPTTIRSQLRRHGITKDGQPPCGGLAAKLWETGREQVANE